MKIVLVKTLSGTIVPAYDTDKEKLKRFKAGEPFMADVTAPRNIKFHKKAFALFNMVFQNQEIYTSVDHLRNDLTVAAGFYDEVVDIHGEITKRPKSISFAAMDDDAFEQYYNAIVETVSKYFNFDSEDIKENIINFY